MARQAILPRNLTDPQGTDRLERGAMNEFGRRLNRVRDAYVAALNRLQYEVIEVNAKSYQFRLDQQVLAVIFADTDALVDSILLEGGENNWFFQNYVNVAFQQGTAKAFANLAAQSPAYQAGRQSLRALLTSPAHISRVALVRAREFEEMKGLTASVKANMSRVLANGVGRGQNPLEISRALTDQLGIEKRRANTIARTEVSQALRTARLDEKDDAARVYGIKSKLMHVSALSVTTRATHAARHANLYTSEEVRAWYAVNGNAINCKCAQIEVVLGKDGKPLSPGVIEAAKRTKEIVEKRLKDAQN